MALGATIYLFNIDLADSDRGIYQALELRVARHPSETAEYMLTRVLAYCCEYSEGLAFSSGIADPDEASIALRDLTGKLLLWIEIGTPDAARLHKASKACLRVAVYSHKDAVLLATRLRGEKIHRAADIELYALDREWITHVATKLERRMKFALTISERHLYLSVGEETFSSVIERISLAS
jgi:uncharacterized protein YaeQ